MGENTVRRMADPGVPGGYRLVLVPEDQVTENGCRPGFVKLTGTPGRGTWDEWGPYRAAGRYGVTQAEVLAQALTGSIEAGRVTGPGRHGPLLSPGEGDPG